MEPRSLYKYQQYRNGVTLDLFVLAVLVALNIRLDKSILLILAIALWCLILVRDTEWLLIYRAQWRRNSRKMKDATARKAFLNGISQGSEKE